MLIHRIIRQKMWCLRVLDNALNSTLPAKKTHLKHMSFNENNTMRSNNNTMYNHNGNNVDIDKEMAELAKNQIYYRGLVNRINGKFSGVQTVIRGGR